MASFIPLTFMLWCSFPFPFSDVFPFKRVKNKRKTKEKKSILYLLKYNGMDYVYGEGHLEQKSHSSNKEREKKKPKPLITFVNKLLLVLPRF